MKAIVVREYGGPDVLRYEEVPDPEPNPGEVLLQVRVAGFNYADIMMRRGLYKGGPQPPFIPGFEVCGTVIRLGRGVVGLREGARVLAFPDPSATGGGYAQLVAIPAQRLFPAPQSLSDQEDGAFPIVFLTAYLALRMAGRATAGESVLIHSAGGGVGTAAVQISKQLGLRIFATASSDEKLERVKALGADVTINYQHRDFAEEVRGETSGRGVDLILEMVGGEVFDKSLQCLAPLGRLVAVGIAGGRVPKADVAQLLYGNLSVVGFHLGKLLTRPDLVGEALGQLNRWIEEQKIRPVVGPAFPLREAAAAHAMVSNRKNYGKVVLLPE
ncbi:MAG TPA: NADPH:quinone oxidoreductase family protein [Candidatus Methylomirabilis sp.]|nr:NADPH:quinone oxidoreductase family protein [Candidatus Methylomirabilis sp.]